MTIGKSRAWVGIAAGVFVLLGGAIAPLWPAASASQAGSGKTDRGSTSVTAPPIHTETVSYGPWIDRCSFTNGGFSSRRCVASLRVLGQGGRAVLFEWRIGLDGAKKMITAMRVPTGLSMRTKDRVSSGILIAKGVDLSLDKGRAHHLEYRSCEAQWCEAVATFDAAFEKGARSAKKATISAYSIDGRAISVTVDIGGIDKAIAALR